VQHPSALLAELDVEIIPRFRQSSNGYRRMLNDQSGIASKATEVSEFDHPKTGATKGLP